MKKILIFFLSICVFIDKAECRKKRKISKKIEILPIYFGECLNFLEIVQDSNCIYIHFNKSLSLLYEKTFKLLIIENKSIFQTSINQLITSKEPNYIYTSTLSNDQIENLKFISKLEFHSISENNETILFKSPNDFSYSIEFTSIFRNKFLFNYRILDTNSSNTTTISVCGNGKIEGNEQCDDGNVVSGDGCSSGCTTEAFFDCSTGICYDKRPPYCLVNLPANHFYKTIELDLTFSKNMKQINFKNSTLVTISVSDINSTQYDWNYSNDINNKTYKFIFTFYVSFQSKTLSITFNDPNSIMDQTIYNLSITQISYQMNTEINEFIYYSPDELSFFNIIDVTLSYLMIALLFAFFPLLILDSLSIFWLYIDMLQTLNLVLYLNINIPDNAVVFFRALLPANFIKIEYLNFFNLSNLDYVSENSVPYAMWEENLTTQFIPNAFFALLFYGMVICLYILVKFFNKILVARLSEKKICSWLVNIFMYLDELMEYSAILRVALITFVPLTLASILQFTDFRYGPIGNSINSTLALICIIYLLCFGLFSCWFLNNSKIDLEDPEIDKKYLPLFDLLKKKAFFKRNFQVFYMLRKFFWIISLVFLENSPLNQIFILIFWSLYITTFMYFKKPYEVDKINLLTLFIEVMILILLLLVGSLECLSDLQENFLSVDNELILGWIILSIGLLLVLVKALSMIIEILINIKSLISNAKFFFKSIKNNENGVSVNEVDNLIDSRYSRDNDVEAIKEVDEEEEDEEKEKQKENNRL